MISFHDQCHVSITTIEMIVKNLYWLTNFCRLIVPTGILPASVECCWIMRSTVSLLNAGLSVMVGQVDTVLSSPMGGHSSSNGHIYDQSIYSTGKNTICLGMFANDFNFNFHIFFDNMGRVIMQL